jgi:cholesterol transport system auxiliary component
VKRGTGAALAAFAFALACAGVLERTPPAVQRFVLDSAPPAAAPQAPGGRAQRQGSGATAQRAEGERSQQTEGERSQPPGEGVLRVARVRVAPAFEREGFVYRRGESRYESDFYNRFFGPPGALVREELIEWLGGSGAFAAVVAAGPPPADWILDAHLVELYADLRDPATPSSVISLALRLLDVRATPPAIALERRYDAREPAADGSPRALVDAWNRALGGVLAQIAADLRAAR